ncbi:MAG: hypothetical protein QW304_03220, partial [Thermoproteota archaeon]
MIKSHYVWIFLIVLSLNVTFVLAQMTIKPDTLPSAVLGEVYEVYLYTDPRVPIDIWEIYS